MNTFTFESISNINWLKGDLINKSLQRILIFNFNSYLEIIQYQVYLDYLQISIKDKNINFQNFIQPKLNELNNFFIKNPKILNFQKEIELINIFVMLCEMIKSYVHYTNLDVKKFVIQHRMNQELESFSKKTKQDFIKELEKISEILNEKIKLKEQFGDDFVDYRIKPISFTKTRFYNIKKMVINK